MKSRKGLLLISRDLRPAMVLGIGLMLLTVVDLWGISRVSRLCDGIRVYNRSNTIERLYEQEVLNCTSRFERKMSEQEKH